MNQISDKAIEKPVVSTPPSFSRKRRRLLLLVGAPLLAAAIAVGGWLLSGGSVSTDDAYVKADKTAIVPRVSGRVVQMAVRENQPVKAEQLLFRIDPEPFRLTLAQAEANLEAARYEIDGLRASVRQKQAELKAAEDTESYWNREFDRNQALVAQHDVPVAKFDEVRHNLDSAHDQVNALRHALNATLATLGGDPDRPTEQHPKVKAAMAARDRAALDLGYTDVTAPEDAVVAPEDVRIGTWMQAGQTAFDVVVRHDRRVEANFKETDLTDVRRGQPAEITVDTYPGRVFHGHVDSLAAATGGEFSILPPQNASGNWVKVVQRIPVRIAIDAAPNDPPLRSGMSATVEIVTGHPHTLAGLFGATPAVAAPSGEADTE